MIEYIIGQVCDLIGLSVHLKWVSLFESIYKSYETSMYTNSRFCAFY